MIIQADPSNYRELHPGVGIKTLVFGDRSLVSELHLKKGAVIPSHQHPEEQSGYLVRGSLRFFGDEGETFVEPGGSWNFKGGTLHGVEAITESVIIGFYSPVRKDLLPQ